MLGTAGARADARCCREAVLFLHHELGRTENALGRAAFTMRYGQRGEWRTVLRDAAAETLREARRAASGYNRDRLRRAIGCYLRLAGCEYPEVAELMLRTGERSSGRKRQTRARREVVHVAAEIRLGWRAAAGEERLAKEGERAPAEPRPDARRGVRPGFAGPTQVGRVRRGRPAKNKSPRSRCAGRSGG